MHTEVLKELVENKNNHMIQFEIDGQLLQKYSKCERILELCLYIKSISKMTCVALGKTGNRVKR